MMVQEGVREKDKADQNMDQPSDDMRGTKKKGRIRRKT